MSTTVIVNPNASRGRVRAAWGKIEARLRDAVGPFDVRHTDAPQAATRLAREALQGGATLIVSVGGDGTLNEVVNGFFVEGRPLNPEAALGILMVGTGGDFRKTLGLSDSMDAQLARLASGDVRVLDVGRLTRALPGGGAEVRYFHNIASFGLSGATDRAVNALTFGKMLGGKIAFQWGMAKALFGYENQPVRIQVDDHFDEVHRVSTAAVCNGQYFGGGMRVAPDAAPDDGLFDVVIVGDISKLELLRRVNAVYTGAHIGLDRVTVVRGRRVVATPAAGAGEVLIDADGEVAGGIPAVFEIVPGALRVRV